MKFFSNKVKYSFILGLILLNLNKNKISGDRILIYCCCDEFYSHYIPVFLNTMLRADKLKRLDFEIGTSINSLNENEKKALNYLKKKYSYSKILIKYNFFINNSSGTFYNNIKVQTWSVRFISQPIIKNKYVYITDIDIVILIENFYLFLINDIIKRKSCYSNVVRKDYNPKRLTGLHFFEYKCQYPLPKLKNYGVNDEEILFNIVKSKGIKIDYNTRYRPFFGIHISPHAPDGKKFGGYDVIPQYIEYIRSDDFKFIYPLLDDFVQKKFFVVNRNFKINYNFSNFNKSIKIVSNLKNNIK